MSKFNRNAEYFGIAKTIIQPDLIGIDWKYNSEGIATQL